MDFCMNLRNKIGRNKKQSGTLVSVLPTLSYRERQTQKPRGFRRTDANKKLEKSCGISNRTKEFQVGYKFSF